MQSEGFVFFVFVKVILKRWLRISSQVPVLYIVESLNEHSSNKPSVFGLCVVPNVCLPRPYVVPNLCHLQHMFNMLNVYVPITHFVPNVYVPTTHIVPNVCRQ